MGNDDDRPLRDPVTRDRPAGELSRAQRDIYRRSSHGPAEDQGHDRPSDTRRDTPRKPPRRVTPDYLQRAAMAYLERYASSTDNLRRVLRRKVDQRCRLRGEDSAEFYEAVDEVVARAVRSGLVDDTRYAEGRVASLRRRGGSARAIRAKLAQKGVTKDTIAAVLATEPEDERAAAHALARRRRLGPYRPGARAPYREKDLAALARAGFSFVVARDVIDGEVAD